MKVLIIGGGLRGCAAATAASHLGYEVVLTEIRQQLGYEFTARGQEWLVSGKSEISVQVGAVAKSLLAEQAERGTQVLLNAQPGGLLLAEGKAVGALIANPFGTQMLEADLVIDTTQTLFAYAPSQTAEMRYCFTVNGITPVFDPVIAVPSSLGLIGNTVCVHTASRPNSAVIELCFARPVDSVTLGNPNRELPYAQRLAADVMVWLRENHTAFAAATLHRLFFNEVWIPHPTVADPPHIDGYHILQTKLPEPMSVRSLQDMAFDIAEEIRSLSVSAPSIAKPDSILTPAGEIPLSQCELYADPATEFRSGLSLQAVRIPADRIPLREQRDVLLAGAGTAGEQVLSALCERGVKTALVELCALPGGSRNLGMVTSYWHGHKTGYNQILDAKAAEIAKQYHASGTSSHVLLGNRTAEDTEQHFYFNTVVCGAQTEGRRVQSLICCDGSGLFRVGADIVIDATGDGVAAYHAGASYMLGDDRDGSVQSSSQWGENTWKSANFMENRFHGDHDMIDMDSYEDCLRSMMLAQYDNSDVRYAPLLTVRESRRVIGDYVLNMDDILDERIFEDTVCVTLTPCDTHGKGSALYADMGTLSVCGKELRARIPYRSYIVRDLDNMLITAKAYSATRDANSLARMNADLRHAGYAVGLAAAQAVKEHKALRQIDLGPVQAELTRQGALPDWTFVSLEIPTPETVYTKAWEGDAEAVMQLYRTEDPAMLMPLRERWSRGERDTLTLRLASWHELPGAVDAACDTLLELLVNARAHPDSKMDRYASARILIGSLAHASAVNLEKLARIISLASAGGGQLISPDNKYYGKIYGHDRVDMWRVPHYHFLFLLAQAVERNADSSLADAMDALLGRSYIGGYVTCDGEAPNSPFLCHSVAPVFCALLELRLAASAARCGGEKGMEVLRSYTMEDRSVLRKFALSELAEIQKNHLPCPVRRPPVLR